MSDMPISEAHLLLEERRRELVIKLAAANARVVELEAALKTAREYVKELETVGKV